MKVHKGMGGAMLSVGRCLWWGKANLVSDHNADSTMCPHCLETMSPGTSFVP